MTRHKRKPLEVVVVGKPRITPAVAQAFAELFAAYDRRRAREACEAVAKRSKAAQPQPVEAAA